jgi:hypothetical protein
MPFSIQTADRNIRIAYDVTHVLSRQGLKGRDLADRHNQASAAARDLIASNEITDQTSSREAAEKVAQKIGLAKFRYPSRFQSQPPVSPPPPRIIPVPPLPAPSVHVLLEQLKPIAAEPVPPIVLAASAEPLIIEDGFMKSLHAFYSPRFQPQPKAGLAVQEIGTLESGARVVHYDSVENGAYDKIQGVSETVAVIPKDIPLLTNDDMVPPEARSEAGEVQAALRALEVLDLPPEVKTGAVAEYVRLMAELKQKGFLWDAKGVEECAATIRQLNLPASVVNQVEIRRIEQNVYKFAVATYLERAINHARQGELDKAGEDLAISNDYSRKVQLSGRSDYHHLQAMEMKRNQLRDILTRGQKVDAVANQGTSQNNILPVNAENLAQSARDFTQ